MFRQEISDGWQVELPETWLTHGNPWEFERREASYEIGFGGRVDPSENEDASQHQMRWRPAERVIATPYDTPIAGWRGKRSEEHTSALQSLMRISYAVFCLKKKNKKQDDRYNYKHN